ncbi:hypothetical protein CTI12_AA564910 [Artemisia annua]|uniref:Uncharacterized protein n=1 Tax=Artemisia annua TaxID=35608 RepID=A0A2U1KTW5_ARTAN|nr:hypothetical protein CTI12_AA564910 [Artemisia annua]
MLEQVLPDYFEESFKSENDVLYLTGNDRFRYKTVVAQKEDRWALWDLQWQAFVSANVPEETSYIHFVKQGQDDYYVTVYAKDGSECAGWAHHADHENEDHVLYTRFTGDDLKLVYDFDETEQLRKYTRAKLVHRNVMGNGFQMRAEIVIEHDSIKKKELLILKGNWHQFGKDCAFQENSMLRFKLVRIDKRYVGGADDGVPVFHVC